MPWRSRFPQVSSGKNERLGPHFRLRRSGVSEGILLERRTNVPMISNFSARLSCILWGLLAFSGSWAGCSSPQSSSSGELIPPSPEASAAAPDASSAPADLTVDLEQLPEWPVEQEAALGDGPVVVHAADANAIAMVLTAALLRGEPSVFLRAGEELSVTGRCRAGSFTAARGALMAAYEPLQDALRPSPLEGRGRPIDLSLKEHSALQASALPSNVSTVQASSSLQSAGQLSGGSQVSPESVTSSPHQGRRQEVRQASGSTSLLAPPSSQSSSASALKVPSPHSAQVQSASQVAEAPESSQSSPASMMSLPQTGSLPQSGSART